VGVEHEQTCSIGVIHVPALDEIIWAAVGSGAWYQFGTGAPRRARVSSKGSLAQGLFCTSDTNSYKRIGRQSAFERLQAASWLTRTWGDCYGYLLVATGRAEAMVDPQMNVWDCAALAPILEEAGGTFTDWQGIRTIHGQEAVATNGRVESQILAITRNFPAQHDA